ncbi:MAG TPA: endonuclease/exonuclease/phosphatase family protein [Armatimonadota bacterium]
MVWSVVNLLILLIVVMVEEIIGERQWWSTLLTYMPQQPLLVPSALLLLIAMVRRHWKGLLWNIPAIVLCAVLLGVNLPLNSAPESGNSVRVITWNAHHLVDGLDRIVTTLVQKQPDIVCLQEVRELPDATRSPVLRQAFPGWSMARGGEVAVLSRFPILRTKVYPISAERVVLEALIDIDGHPLTVIAIHYVTTMTHGSLEQRSGSRQSYLRHTVTARSKQNRTVLAIAACAGSPVLIAGDFNTPPRGIIYRQLTQHYVDAFSAAGFGTGYTYPARFPIMQIDHLFVSNTIGIRCCTPITATASDHLPVMADLCINGHR